MSVDIEIGIWFDDDALPANQRLWQMITAVAAWPQATGDWRSFEVSEKGTLQPAFAMGAPIELDSLEDIILNYEQADTHKFTIVLPFHGWRYIQDWPIEKGYLQLTIQTWGREYMNLKWPKIEEKFAGLASLHIRKSAPYHAWLRSEDSAEVRAKNQAVEENLGDLIDLLTRVIEVTNPTIVRLFEDTLDFDKHYSPYAHLVYYRDPAEVINDLQFLQERKFLDERVRDVTEETVELLLEAGDWSTIRTASGWIVPSQRYFIDNRLRSFYPAFLQNAADLGHPTSEVVAAAIATFERPLAEVKTRYRDVVKVLPVLERHREEAVLQLKEALSHGSAGMQWQAVSALSALGGEQAIEALVAVINGRRRHIKAVRIKAIQELHSQAGNPQVEETLLRATQHQDKEIRTAAVRSLITAAPEALRENIELILNDEDVWVHSAGMKFLETLGDADFILSLIDKNTELQFDLILLLGKLKDPRSKERLRKILTEALPAQHTEQKKAIKYLAQFEDPSDLPIFLTILEKKTGWRDVNEIARSTLLALLPHVGDDERAAIRATVAAYEARDGKTRLYAAKSGEGEGMPSTFTPESYRAFIAEIKDLKIRHSGYSGSLGASSYGKTRELARKILIELPTLYRARLPVILLARCPICGGQVTEAIDTYSLAGPGWWISEPDGFGWFGRRLQEPFGYLRPLGINRFMEPSYQADCDHVQAVYYGVNLNNIIPDDILEHYIRYVVIGSERPGVLHPFMEQDGSFAVIHSVPIGRLDDVDWEPCYTVYFVSYFSQDDGAFQRSLLPQKWYDDDFLWPYEQMDYDLEHWVTAGNLAWLGTKETGYPLRQEKDEKFPYSKITGLPAGRWAVDTQTGAKLLPPVSGRGLYGPKLPRSKTLIARQEQALQKRDFRFIK